ncbi:DUF6303 family protein [Streptomyces sp. NPDC058619]|uniref:DUF6303 family protein n=1 Tax=unclassified Streptomyces TaxID=2593676 RepID=UPI00364B8BFE
MSKQIFRAQMSLRCCGTTASARTTSPCWQLYVAMTGLVSEWPTFTWPTSTAIPNTFQRQAALAELGFTLAENAEWEWIEHIGPDYHPHPARVFLLGAAKVRPLPEGAA